MRRENNAIINRRFYGQTAMIGYYKKHVFALADRLANSTWNEPGIKPARRHENKLGFRREYKAQV
jgi:hypothetical protein